MCIVIHKRAGVELPDYATLQRCWDNNSDGAGFCFARNGIVQGYKGYMNFDNFMDALMMRASDDDAMLIHFRIATHGGVTRQGTHPFPLSSNKRALNALEWVSDVGVAHNGIVVGFGVSNYGNVAEGMSDTQEFISDVLNTPSVRAGLFDDPAIKYLVGEATTSKWAFMDATGKTVLFGKWHKDNGLWYSNEGYLSVRKYSKWHGSAKSTGASNMHQSWEATPRDYAPPDCPALNNKSSQEVCRTCQFFDSDRNFCDVFEEEIIF